MSQGSLLSTCMLICLVLDINGTYAKNIKSKPEASESLITQAPYVHKNCSCKIT